MKKKLIKFLCIFAVFSLLFAIYAHFENTVIEITKYTVRSERLPSAFDGFKIVQVSDLHSADFGNGYSGLIKKIRACKPDIIVVTGDISATDDDKDINSAISFIKKAVKIAPIYYVTGNHEAVFNNYVSFMGSLNDLGVTILNDSAVTVSIGNESIKILGVSDPDFDEASTEKAAMKMSLDILSPSGEEYTVLLSHRPEFFNMYAKYNIDLVFAGHAHGGQIRLPFIGGLYAPGQGVFPKYTSGKHVSNGTTMIVSRGIGPSSFPFRINNNPELVCVTLKKA